MGVVVRQKQPGKGNPWWVFINHRRRRKSKLIGDKNTAELVAVKLRERLALGHLDPLDEEEEVRTRPTFAAYAQEWLKAYAETACKESTAHNYGNIIKNHLGPAFGGKLLDEITRRDVKELVLEKLQEGLNAKTVKNVRLCLSSIMSSAVEDEILGLNPAADIGKKIRRILRSQKLRKKVDFLTREESTVFLNAVRQHFPGYTAFFLTALRTGMRLGELLGLQPGDVDFNGGFIEVQRAVVRGRVTTPKNGKARRIDMSRQLAGTLKLHLIERKRDTLARGWSEAPLWLFSNEEGKPLDPSNVRDRVFHRALEKAGLRRIRLHELRHSFASQLLMQGESLAYVRDQMGHASIQTTVDLYGHLVPGSNRQAVDKLDDVNDAHPDAPQAHPEPRKNTKGAKGKAPNPLILLNCGGKI